MFGHGRLSLGCWLRPTIAMRNPTGLRTARCCMTYVLPIRSASGHRSHQRHGFIFRSLSCYLRPAFSDRRRRCSIHKHNTTLFCRLYRRYRQPIQRNSLLDPSRLPPTTIAAQFNGCRRLAPGDVSRQRRVGLYRRRYILCATLMGRMLPRTADRAYQAAPRRRHKRGRRSPAARDRLYRWTVFTGWQCRNPTSSP